MLGHRRQDLVLFLGLVRVLEALSCLHDEVHVDPRLRVQSPPHEDGHVEKQGLEEENDRHPLVVRDHVSLVVLVFLRDILVERQVVGIAHPAVVVRVLLVVALEVGRDPAADRFTHVLLRTDDHGAGDQHEGRHPVTETVREVVVVAGCHLRHPADLVEDLVHLSLFSTSGDLANTS